RVNDAGLILGNEGGLPLTPATHAVLWTPQGDGYTLVHLAELDGGASSYAFDLDEEGRIVGKSTDAQGTDVAVLWRPGPSGYAPEILPVPFARGWCSIATAISGRGEIAGSCASPEQPSVGVLWNIDGNTVRFEATFDPLPGTATSEILALNDSGLAVGGSGEG